MKKLLAFCVLVIVLISAAVCSAGTVTNGGLTLSIPDEYMDLLVIETPENDEEGCLFSVSEKASIEAMHSQENVWEGAGWLFSIGRVSEEKLHEMRCDDIPGQIYFAKDASGNHYVYYHPTDVRIVRDDYSDPDLLKGWAELNEWAATVRTTFVTDNEGMTAEICSNTVLDAYLARVMYRDDTEYTVSSLEFGPQQPNGIKAADYIAPLTEGVIYQPIHDGEAPDGEYVVLDFPKENIRFDFFFMDGYENYVRQVWFNGEHELLYKAEFQDETIKASEVMNDFYHAVVLNNSLGYTPDDMVGVWAEKIAGRGFIEITKSAEEGKYDVLINWSSSAWQKTVWTMTAEATGSGAELRYENGKRSDLTWKSENDMTEEVVYENGTGTFNLLSTFELVWDDETGHAADDTVFISAGERE